MQTQLNNTFEGLKKKIREQGDSRFIAHVPDEFLTVGKLENFILAREEEKQHLTRLKSYPYHIVIETTNCCNLACPLCSTGIANANENPITRKKGFMSYEQFKKIIDEAEGYVIELFLQNWGESTLAPDIIPIVEYAASKKIWISFSSNFSREFQGDFLERFIKAGLAHLHIDVDGTTQEVYEKYRRRGDLTSVLDNVKKAVAIKKKFDLKYPLIETSMLAMRHNEHQFEDFKKLCQGLGVDRYTIDRIQVNPNTSTHWLPKNPDYVYRTYRGEDRCEPCHWPWSGIVINWDGTVSPCCIIDDPKTDFGNVFDLGIKGVWNNQFYISSRAEFGNLKDIKRLTVCNVCKNETHSEKLKRVGNSFSLTF